jgi:hypothetical protein
MNPGRGGLLTVLVLCVFSLWAEVPYVVVPPETVQRRKLGRPFPAPLYL